MSAGESGIGGMYRLKLYVVVFLAGFTTLGMEVIGPRALANMYGNTTTVWAVMITVTLGAMAIGYLGATWIQPCWARNILTGCLALAGVVLLFAVRIVYTVADYLAVQNVNAIMFTAGVAFLVPTVMLGAVPVLALSLMSSGHDRPSHAQAGRVYATSTVGGMVGGLLCALWIVQALGIASTFRVLSALLLLASLLTAIHMRVVACLCVIGCVWCYPHTAVDRKPIEHRLLFHSEGVYQTVRVYEGINTGYRSVWLGPNSHSLFDPVRQESMMSYARPIRQTLATRPKGRLLIIGGAGNSIALEAEALGWTADSVEIDPLVAAVSQRYCGVPSGQVFVEDARAFLRWSNHRQYDVVVVDAFSAPGVIPTHLCTAEFYALLRSATKDSGVIIVHVHCTLSDPYSDILAGFIATMRSAFRIVNIVPVADSNPRSSRIQSVLVYGSSESCEGIPFAIDPSMAVVMTDDYNPLESRFGELQASYLAARPWGWQSPR